MHAQTHTHIHARTRPHTGTHTHTHKHTHRPARTKKTGIVCFGFSMITSTAVWAVRSKVRCHGLLQWSLTMVYDLRYQRVDSRPGEFLAFQAHAPGSTPGLSEVIKGVRLLPRTDVQFPDCLLIRWYFLVDKWLKTYVFIQDMSVCIKLSSQVLLVDECALWESTFTTERVRKQMTLSCCLIPIAARWIVSMFDCSQPHLSEAFDKNVCMQNYYMLSLCPDAVKMAEINEIRPRRFHFCLDFIRKVCHLHIRSIKASFTLYCLIKN